MLAECLLFDGFEWEKNRSHLALYMGTETGRGTDVCSNPPSDFM